MSKVDEVYEKYLKEVREISEDGTIGTQTAIDAMMFCYDLGRMSAFSEVTDKCIEETKNRLKKERLENE